MAFVDEAEQMFFDSELDDVLSIGSDDAGVDSEQDAEADAFEVMQMAYGLARRAVKTGLDHAEELARLRDDEQDKATKEQDSPRSTAATETPASEPSTDITLDDDTSGNDKTECQRTQTWSLRPSVGSWLRPAPKVQLHLQQQPPAEVPAAATPVSPSTARRESVRSRRKIIGAVVRAPTEVKVPDEEEPVEPLPPSPTSMPACPASPTSTFPLGGSAAGSLRRAKRMAANKAPLVPQRLDLDDTASETEAPAASTRNRSSSLAKTYSALGVELFHMGEKDQDEQAAAPPVSAMMLDLAPLKAPRSRPGSATRPASATRPLGAGDLSAFKVSWAAPAPMPELRRPSRGKSSTAFRFVKAKEDVGLLPSLAPLAAPGKPIEWSAGPVRSQKRWANNMTGLI